MIGSSNHNCTTETSLFGSPWDDIIEDCCTDIREADGDEGSNENTESKTLEYSHDFHSSLRVSLQKISVNESIIYVRRFVCPPIIHMCAVVRTVMSSSKTISRVLGKQV